METIGKFSKILGFFIGMFIVYCVFAFVNWSWNAMDWPVWVRCFYGVWFILAMTNIKPITIKNKN